MTGEGLAKNIRDLYVNDTARLEMAKASRGLGRPDACGRITDIALSLLKERRNSKVAGRASV
jgi:UDP-N-acetylglucosamine:LPS N-acetylglucosamine transferase